MFHFDFFVIGELFVNDVEGFMRAFKFYRELLGLQHYFKVLEELCDSHKSF